MYFEYGGNWIVPFDIAPDTHGISLNVRNFKKNGVTTNFTAIGGREYSLEAFVVTSTSKCIFKAGFRHMVVKMCEFSVEM